MLIKKLFITVLSLDLLMLNILLGFLLVKYTKSISISYSDKESVDIIPQISPNKESVNGHVCGNACISYIDQKCAGLSITPIIKNIIPTQKPTPVAKLRSVVYLPIPGSGNTGQTSWTDLSGTEFYLDKDDYPGFKEAYLEVNMKLFQGNGYAFIRLYDVTNKRAVDGGEIQTNSQTSTVVTSGKLSIWEGRNLYKMQARSLTADTTYFESGRIRILSEN